jgi:hypothetical protein
MTLGTARPQKACDRNAYSFMHRVSSATVSDTRFAGAHEKSSVRSEAHPLTPAVTKPARGLSRAGFSCPRRVADNNAAAFAIVRTEQIRPEHLNTPCVTKLNTLDDPPVKRVNYRSSRPAVRVIDTTGPRYTNQVARCLCASTPSDIVVSIRNRST